MQISEISKSKNEALKSSLQRAFLENFSSVAYIQMNLEIFLTIFQENSKIK
jgi:hypothetical protein